MGNRRDLFQRFLEDNDFSLKIVKKYDYDDGTTAYTIEGYHKKELVFGMNEFYLSTDIDISGFTPIQVIELTDNFDFVYDLIEFNLEDIYQGEQRKEIYRLSYGRILKNIKINISSIQSLISDLRVLDEKLRLDGNYLVKKIECKIGELKTILDKY